MSAIRSSSEHNSYSSSPFIYLRNISDGYVSGTSMLRTSQVDVPLKNHRLVYLRNSPVESNPDGHIFGKIQMDILSEPDSLFFETFQILNLNGKSHVSCSIILQFYLDDPNRFCSNNMSKDLYNLEFYTESAKSRRLVAQRRRWHHCSPAVLEP